MHKEDEILRPTIEPVLPSFKTRIPPAWRNIETEDQPNQVATSKLDLDSLKEQLETRSSKIVQEVSQSCIRTMTDMIAALRQEIASIRQELRDSQQEKSRTKPTDNRQELNAEPVRQELTDLKSGQIDLKNDQVTCEKRLQSLEVQGATSSNQLQGLADRVGDLEQRLKSSPSDVQEVSGDTQIQHANSNMSVDSVASNGNIGADAQEPVDGHRRASSPANTPVTQVSAKSSIGFEAIQVEIEECYSFNRSTWDVVTFIGTDTLGLAVSALTAVMVLCQIGIQIVYVVVVRTSFREPQVDAQSIEAANAWRISIGHNMQYVDSLHEISLTARVCGHDVSLETSGAQVALVGSLYDYLSPDDNINGERHGLMLCMVALTCWYLMVSKEMHDTMHLIRALAHLPRCEKTKIARDSDGTCRLATISYAKFTISLAFFVYRLGIVCVLIYAGTCFLVYTIDVTELILNAVALEIILRVDELLFEALATNSARHLIRTLQPVPMATVPQWHGVDLKAVVMSVLIPLALLVVYILMLDPMAGDLDGLYHAFCGGNKDFMWAVSKLDMAKVAPSQSYTGDFHLQQSFKTLAIEEAIRGRTSAPQYAMWLSAAQDLKVEGSYTFQEALDAQNSLCKDQDEGPALHFLRDVLKDQSVNSCKDASRWCTSALISERSNDGRKGIMTRALCPQTCGCFNMRSHIFVVTGCPTDCTRPSNSEHFAALQNGSCTKEPSVEELRSWPFFLTWLDQLATYAKEENTTNKARSAAVTDTARKLWQHGCAAVSMPDVALLEPCDNWGALPFKTLRNLCPMACGCLKGSSGAENTKEACPWSCQSCSSSWCTDFENICRGGTTTNPCSCSQGSAVVYGTDELGYSLYTCCNDGSGQKDICGKFESHHYCDICETVGMLNKTASYEYLGIVRTCSVAADSCKIAHHCANTCPNLQGWYGHSTDCCIPIQSHSTVSSLSNSTS